MPCPSSPEPDGFHRFKVPSTGHKLAAACVYYGAQKTHRPFDGPAGVWTPTPERMQTSRAKGVAASHAAKRAKREATP